MAGSGHLPVVAALGTAQTLAWASTYYLPAMLAVPMAKDIGVSTPTVFAAFSMALIVSALLGPYAGRSIDRWGARPVLSGTNLVFALGLAALANARGPAGLFGAWVILGIGMGSGLYEAAFSALVRLYGRDSRNAITGITLIAGFASTIGWPLSNLLEHQVGWRGACYAWAVLHLLIGLPSNLSLPRPRPLGQASGREQAASASDAVPLTGARSKRAGVLLATVFAATWFISTAMAAHLPRLLQSTGATLATAVAVGALIGPAQVAGRLLEFGFLRRLHPLLSARLAALMHPIGAFLLLFVGGPAAAVFAVMHGAGNGILTIANGTLPLALFGTKGYGQRQGMLMVPARLAQASSPWLFGLCLDQWGSGALWVSGAVGLLVFGALFAMPKPPDKPESDACPKHPSSSS
ncbi:MAG: MFS transporter [Pseudomonadota bacterium]|nr:MFS transporter [Pseudomonadota bacterium]